MTICKINYNLRCHVPFLGILVFRKSLLPFLGDAIKPCFWGQNGADACPKIGVSCFLEKAFAKNGT